MQYLLLARWYWNRFNTKGVCFVLVAKTDNQEFYEMALVLSFILIHIQFEHAVTSHI